MAAAECRQGCSRDWDTALGECGRPGDPERARMQQICPGGQLLPDGGWRRTYVNNSLHDH